MRQLTFEDLTYLDRKRKTRRQRFLERMDRILPWDTFPGRIEAPLSKGGKRASSHSGWRPCYASTLCSSGSSLSDPAAEDAILDHAPMRVFAGVEP